MQDVRQTKEGFIKSMILFFVLLGICFAPFIAFSQVPQTNNPTKVEIKSNVDGITTADKMDVSNKDIHFELSLESSQLHVMFSTGYKCAGYTIEGKLAGSNEFVSVLYCNSDQCVDTRNTVRLTLDTKEQSYDLYRVKTVLTDGEVVYSEERQVANATQNKISLVNTAVAEKLHLKLTDASEYTYSIMSIKGESICEGEQVGSDAVIDLSNWEAGFYIISFKSLSGLETHYKFFKTINL